MNGVRSLSPVHTGSPIWVMLKIFVYNLLRLTRYECEGVVKFNLTRWVQQKILVLIINLFSLNFTSIKTEGRGWVLAKTNVPWGGRGVASRKWTRANKGEGGQKSGILSERTFWMSPKFKLLDLQGDPPPPQFPCLLGYPDLPMRKTLRVFGLLPVMIFLQSKKLTLCKIRDEKEETVFHFLMVFNLLKIIHPFEIKKHLRT